MKADVLKEIYSISVQWILQEPFWGHLLSGIPKQIVSQGPSLSWGVAGTPVPVLQLEVHPQSWNRLPSRAAKKQLLQHELLHLLYHQPMAANHYSFPLLYNLACDWVVQPFQALPTVPQLPIHENAFFTDQTEQKLSVDDYYMRLESFWLEQLSTSTPDPRRSMLDRYQASSANQAHQAWHSVIAKLSTVEKEIMKASIDQLILSTLDRVGPEAVAHWPTALLLLLQQRQPSLRPTLNWRRVLRLFAGRHRRTQIKHTLRRPSKRYGTTPGIRIQQKQKILVVLDTSASIQASQFYEFFSEIHHLWRQGAAIHLVECDSMVRRDYPYRGQHPTYVSGRGGSSFEPAIQWANQVYQPDAILYFTDGDAPPLQVSSRFPLLWVLSKRNANNGLLLQGQQIHL